ncbi:MAG TPA: TetR/AcrR family transcriptional regulator [Sulfurospirillum arcachonense]|nr:TetR/AcrR family transcriptional regulator [Sulfurospirillum arcachonense]
MLRKVDKNEKKRAIALAAIPLLAKFGLVKTSVEAIAKEANVAKGTVYLYFKTKEEIVLEIWNYANELLDKNRKENFSKDSTASEKINHYFDFSILEEDHNMDILLKLLAMNMSTILNFSHNGLVKHFKQERIKEIDTLEKILKEGTNSGEFKTIDINLTANLFANSFHGTLLNSIAINKNIDEIRAIIHPQIDFLIDSIKS